MIGLEDETEIGLENLLSPAPNASFMDLKLGTSTITIFAMN